MTVPDGYFDDFARRMMERIPAETPVVTEVKRTTWQKIRPYAYMAAMFAGVYLMMNMFTLAPGPKVATDSLQAPMLADLVNSGTAAGYIDDYVTVSNIDLYDDLYEAGYDFPESF